MSLKAPNTFLSIAEIGFLVMISNSANSNPIKNQNLRSTHDGGSCVLGEQRARHELHDEQKERPAEAGGGEGGGGGGHDLVGVDVGRRQRQRRTGQLDFAETLHVLAHLGTVVVLVAVAVARGQFGRLLLPQQNGQRVVAARTALAAVEHGLAVAVVVVERRVAQLVRRADPLGHAARHHGHLAGRLLHLRPTHLHALLLLFAALVRAATLQHQNHAFVKNCKHGKILFSSDLKILLKLVYIILGFFFLGPLRLFPDLENTISDDFSELKMVLNAFSA